MLFNELNRRDVDTNSRIAARQQELENEFRQKEAASAQQADAAAITSLTKVAKAKNFNVVFSNAAVLYADNDITDEVLKDMNK